MDPDPGATSSVPATTHAAAAPPPQRVRVWDLPTRLFHWALAITVVASVASAKIGGNAMEWHVRFGLAALVLLAFRLLWGVVGGHWSRFGTFAYGPGALWRYLRGRPQPDDRFELGHSPLGSLSVWALLAVLLLQVATGLVADDEIAFIGPLNRFVSSALASQATSYHKQIGEWLVIGLAVLHVAAVLFYLVVKRRNLVSAMWHGDQAVPARASAQPLPTSRDGAAQRLLALVLFLLCLALGGWVWSLGG